MKRAIAVLVALAVLAVGYRLLRSPRAPAKTAEKPAAPVAPTQTPRTPAPQPEGERRGSAPMDLAVLMDDDPPGTLRLEGLVLGGDDQPVAGAAVTINSQPPRSVTSDEDGSFHIDQLVGRQYTLVARAEAGVGGPVT